MTGINLKDFTYVFIYAIDSFNFILEKHHLHTAVIAYAIGKELGLSNTQLSELVIAASLHDIGALSTKDQEMLVKEDVTMPQPHCEIGSFILRSFTLFEHIAKIIKYHHISIQDIDEYEDVNIPIESFIIHMADRIDISINHDNFILDEKETVIEKIKTNSLDLFRFDIIDAFLKVSKSDVFWLDINNESLDQLFNKIDFNDNDILSFDLIEEFAFTISQVIDLRSRYTASHSYTVANLAFEIGKLLHLDNDKLKKLRIAGLLHDIGKISIDTSILEKKGKLDQCEYNRIKTHPYFTSKILYPLMENDEFADIIDWASNHHEKADGTGYPYAKSILDVGSKIIAYSDIISSLMEDRPYRNGMHVDKAFDILKSEFAESISIGIFAVIKKTKIVLQRLLQDVKKKSTRNIMKFLEK